MFTKKSVDYFFEHLIDMRESAAILSDGFLLELIKISVEHSSSSTFNQPKIVYSDFHTFLKGSFSST